MIQYDIWQARHDTPSQCDGDGVCLETVNTLKEAEQAVAEYQTGGHAAWMVLREGIET